MNRFLCYLLTCFFIVLHQSNCLASGTNHKRIKLKTKERKYQTTDLLEAYLKRSSFKQKILARNMANQNTPGYKADDVLDVKEYSELMEHKPNKNRLPMAKTKNNHLIGNKLDQNNIKVVKLKDPYEVKPNGNNVSMAQQMLKASANQQDYSRALKQYTSLNSLITSVLGR